MAVLTLYRGLTSAGLPLIHLLLKRRMARGKEDPERFGERLGQASHPRPAGRLVWLHGASVGEALSMLALIRRLMERSPELNVLVTTGTVTSARLMAERLPDGVIHQYAPVDRLAWVRRFLDHWRPDAVLWIESELWPNMVTEVARRDIPIALVNGRMSANSYKKWTRARATARTLLGGFYPILAQDETIAGRLTDLGARQVKVTGSLKYAAEPLPFDSEDAALLKETLGDRTRWVAASTHDDEEISIVAAHRRAAKSKPDLLTIIVPRHPSRGDRLADEMRRGGLKVAQRSLNEPVTPDTQIYIADTMGELGLFFRHADLVFVGGSLVPKGCQNLFEPAQLGCAILHGPDTSNFEAIAKELKEAGGAIPVSDREDLCRQVADLLGDTDRRGRVAARARQVAMAKLDVIEVVIEALAPLLEKLEPAVGPLVEAQHASA